MYSLIGPRRTLLAGIFKTLEEAEKYRKYHRSVKDWVTIEILTDEPYLSDDGWVVPVTNPK